MTYRHYLLCLNLLQVIAEQVNMRDENAQSPLDIASALGRTDMVKELLVRGADIISTNIKGGIPYFLHIYYIFNRCKDTFSIPCAQRINGTSQSSSMG